MNDVDTLDQLPEPFDIAFLNQVLFQKLQTYNGIVIRGKATPKMSMDDMDWGRWYEIKSSNELIQIRVTPPGFLGASNAQRDPTVVTVAYRRWEPSKNEYASACAILWPSLTVPPNSTTLKQMMSSGSKPIGARNLPLLSTNIFRNHDAAKLITETTRRRFALTDDSNFQCIKPTSFTVISTHSSGTNLHTTRRAMTGYSGWKLAGELAGTEIEDKSRPAAEEIMSAKHDELVANMTSQLNRSCGAPRALNAAANALAVCELLSADGMIGLLANETLNGSLPDMLHNPGGVPLLVAAAARVAAYPERFKLSRGTVLDEFANRELRSIFESQWAPFPYGRGVFAIDVVLMKALSEAREAGEANVAIQNNLLYLQRLGQRAVSGIYGATRSDHAKNSKFGNSVRTNDLVEEARRRTTHKIIGEDDIDEQIGAFGTLPLSQKRTTLLAILNSVELWLRTGTYLGIQINTNNGADVSQITTQDLKNAFEHGIEESLKEMSKTGTDEKDARAAANVIREGFSELFQDDKISIDDVQSAVDDLSPCMKTEALCVDAFQQAVSCIAASYCQGVVVHLQMHFQVFVSHKQATVTCATCDTAVHVLTSTFLTNMRGECPRCHRPRCVRCCSAPDDDPNRTHCKRCAPRRRKK